MRSVFDHLNKLSDEMIKIRKDKAPQAKKEIKINFNLMSEKRKDDISEIQKSKGIMLSTYEGYVKQRQSLYEIHMKNNIEVCEEDLAY